MVDSNTIDRNRELPLFIYGTLKQGESGEDVIRADVLRRAGHIARMAR